VAERFLGAARRRVAYESRARVGAQAEQLSQINVGAVDLR